MYAQLSYYYTHRKYKLEYQKKYYQKNKETISRYYKNYYYNKKTQSSYEKKKRNPTRCKSVMDILLYRLNNYHNKKMCCFCM